jgi:hypothetical protein
MKDTERRRLDMFIRVRQFGQEHAAQLPPTSFAGEQLNILNTAINALETHTQAQSSGKSTVRQSTSSKAAARDEVMRDLEAISRTARAMGMTMPGLGDKFRIPHKQSDQAVLAVARAAAADARDLKPEFIRRGMPADFLEDLFEDIDEMEAVIGRKAQGKGSHVAATAAIDTEIERGMDAVRELDAVVRNTFSSDIAALAAWESASHVERPPRRTTSTTTPSPTPPTP